MRIATLRPIAACALLAASNAWAAAYPVDEHRPADPQGQVEIINVSGRVEVIGWDKPEIEVAGTLSADIDKLEISAAGNRTTVRVVPVGSEGLQWGLRLHFQHEAILTVHVPRGASISASLVSADITVRDVLGDQELQTVSGEVRSTVARDARIHTVSGDVHLSAGSDSGLLEIGTVSGDVEVTGGHGDVSVNTISGASKLVLGALTHARFKSVSGDYHIRASLAADGLLEGQSVSGDLDVEFTGGEPEAEFELHTFSGDLKTCFGPKAVHENYGPGSRLSFRSGTGSAHVRIDTKSGDVSVCAQQP
jgi:putative adhesin